MARKGIHKILIATITALAGLSAGLQTPSAATSAPTPTGGTPLPTPVGTQIATSVSLSYQASVNGPAQTLTTNLATVIVQQTAGVALTPAQATQHIVRPARTLYPVTLRNTGNGQDVFTIIVSAAQAPGWSGTLISTGTSAPVGTQVSLGAGQSQSFYLVVTPPATLPRTTTATLVLKAVSNVDPTQSAQAGVVTTSGAGTMAH